MANKKKTGLSTVVLLAGTLGAAPIAADEPRENQVITQPANRADFGRRGQGDKVNRLRTIGSRNAALAATVATGKTAQANAADRVEPKKALDKSSLIGGVDDGRSFKAQSLMSTHKTALDAKDAGEVNRFAGKRVESRLISQNAPQKRAALAAEPDAAKRDNPDEASARQH